MNTLESLLLIVLLCIIVIVIIVIVVTILEKNNIQPYHPDHPHKHPLIGGCHGTRYGCCSDGITPKGGKHFLC
jgi:hypothetical protein